MGGVCAGGGVGGVIGEEWLEEVQISGACEENAKLYLGFTVTAICVAWKKNKNTRCLVSPFFAGNLYSLPALHIPPA